MTEDILRDLSRRERQIMDVILMLGEATAAEIHDHMPGDISDGSLRKLVRILEEKGHLRHTRRGREHLYRPTARRKRLQRQAAGDLLRTFFQGSLSDAVSALLDAKQGKIDDAQAEEIRRLIDAAETEGR